MTEGSDSNQQIDHRFSFFTNHTLALIAIAQDPKIRMREIAEKIGITERAVQRIVDDLSSAGYINIIKDGRRNSYRICRETSLGDPVRSDMNLGGLLEVLVPSLTAVTVESDQT